jgi:hypothetical protein
MENTVPPKDFQAHLGGALETATRVLTDPKGFYASLPREGSLEGPLIFAAIMLVASAVIQAVLGLIGLYPMGFFAALILTPIFGAIGLLIGAVIVLFASRALGGEATFESSIRIVAYASAIFPIQAVLNIIPYAPLLASAYGMYLIIVAVTPVHRVPEDKAWKILGGIAAVLLLLSLLSTIAGRRAVAKLDTWQKQLDESSEKMAPHLEKSAENLGKAAEKWAEEMERATEKMRQEMEKKAEEEEE